MYVYSVSIRQKLEFQCFLKLHILKFGGGGGGGGGGVGTSVG